MLRHLFGVSVSVSGRLIVAVSTNAEPRPGTDTVLEQDDGAPSGL